MVTVVAPPTIAFPPGVRGAGDGIDGMLTQAEGATLAELARGRVVLEIGSWCGLSTIIMAGSAKMVYALDWHRGDGEMGSQDTLSEFFRNIRRHAFGRCPIVPLIGPAADVLPVLRDASFDMVYVDGAHDPASVQRDTAQAKRLVRRGGFIAWHDANRTAVRCAINDFVGSANYGPDRLAWAEVF